MTTALRDAILSPFAAVKFRAGGVLDDVANVYVRRGGITQRVWSAIEALAVNAIFTGAYGAGTSGSTISVATADTTLSIVGGRAPFTYAWARTDGGGHSWTINSPSALNTRFTTLVAPYSLESATFEMTVTDANGTVVVGPEITAYAENYGGYA